MTDGERVQDSADSVIVDCELAEPPETVWKALTDPSLVAAWLMPNDISPQVGSRFAFHGGPEAGGTIDCEILAAEPNRLLRYSWRGGAAERDADARPLDTIVTFELSRTASGGTHLRIVHSGFAASVDRSTIMRAGALGAPSDMPATPRLLRLGDRRVTQPRPGNRSRTVI